MDLELWLHRIWGQGFYKMLVGNAIDYAIPKAFKKADETNSNILIFDGFSIRELLLFRKVFNDRLRYTVGKAPAPTTTENVTKKIFQITSLKEALTGTKLYWGRKWKGEVIEDITNPPRIGNQRGLMFLTYYPDSPLHHAISYGTAFVQDVSNVMKQMIRLVTELSKNSPLVLSGDHGYIYIGDNPNKFLWLPYRRKERFGEEYAANFIEVDGLKVAVGRFHAPVSRRSRAVIIHGGVSLSESLVPIITIEAEA